jgi:hypothetical protein
MADGVERLRSIRILHGEMRYRHGQVAQMHWVCMSSIWMGDHWRSTMVAVHIVIGGQTNAPSTLPFNGLKRQRMQTLFWIYARLFELVAGLPTSARIS